MTREELFTFVAETFDVAPDYPWKRYPAFAVLRHEGSGKWFALAMRVHASKLGLDLDEEVEVLNVKTDPDDGTLLRMADQIMPAYHMNKKHWISVLLDGGLPVEVIKDLLATSFELTE